MAKKEETYPEGYPRQQQNFSDMQKFKFDVFEAIKEIALETTEKAFEDKGYKKQEGRAGEYGNGESYGAGTSLNHFNIRLSSRPQTNTYFEKIIYFGGKKAITDVNIGWDAKNETIELAYKNSEFGAFRGYGTKAGAELINVRENFVIKSLSAFKKELKELFKSFAEKEVAYVTSTKIGIEDKTEKSINSMVETSMKKFSLKNLMTSSDEDLSNAVDKYINENKNDIPVNELTKGYLNTMRDKVMSVKNDPDTTDPILKNRLGMGIKRLSAYVNPEIQSYVESLGGKISDSSASDKVIISFPDMHIASASKGQTSANIYIHISPDKVSILNGEIVDLSERIQTLLPKIIKRIQADFNSQTVSEGVKNKEDKTRMNSPEVIAANSPGKLLFDDIEDIEDEGVKTAAKNKLKKFGVVAINELKPSEKKTYFEELEKELEIKEIAASDGNAAGSAFLSPAAFKPGGDLGLGGKDDTKEKFENTSYAKGQKQRPSVAKSMKEGDSFWTTVELNPGSGYVPKGMDKNYVMGQHNKSLNESVQPKKEDKSVIKESLIKRKFSSLNENEEKGINKRYIVTEQRTKQEEENRWKKLAMFETYETINRDEVIEECGCDVVDNHEVSMAHGQEENEREFMQRNSDVEAGGEVDGREVVIVAKPNSLSNAMLKVFRDDYMNESRAYILDLNSGNLVSNPNFRTIK